VRRPGYLPASQRPVAPARERLGAVVGGVDDDAVPVVAVLPQGVGDVADRLVHRGHHGGELPAGDVGHVAVRVDVGLGRLQRGVDGLQGEHGAFYRVFFTGYRYLFFVYRRGTQHNAQRP